MANATLTCQAPDYDGVVVVAAGTVGNGETCTISAAAAQGSLDFDSLVVRITNGDADGTAVVRVESGDSAFSGACKGDLTLTTIASAKTVVVGGKFFESARFQGSDGKLVFTLVTGVGPLSFEAYQNYKA